MYIDVIDLKEFYARPLGAVARRLISNRVRGLWRDVKGMYVFGLGYAAPFLSVFRGEAARVGAFMPAAQGVIGWPDEGPYRTALVEDVALPLPDSSADRVLVIHSLETTEATQAMLREIWRVLAPGGRVLLVVPNRRGLWARLDTTPFGHGRPFSRVQLSRLLRDALFSPVEWSHALYMPPFSWHVLVRAAAAWERFGTIMWPAFSGVILVEATKQVNAATPERSLKAIRARLRPSAARPLVQRVSPTVSEEKPPARQSGSA